MLADKRGVVQSDDQSYSGKYGKDAMKEHLPGSVCPLCGKPNDCAVAKYGRHDVDCWCNHTSINPASLALVPEDLRDKACLCRQCAEKPPVHLHGHMNSENLTIFLDPQGKVLRWPKKKADQLMVLKYIQSKFDKNKRYTEKEVNGIILCWHSFNDYALLRRELYDHFLLNRTPDGKEYWVDEEHTSK